MGDIEDIYRDPLFGVAVLIAIVALIILMDYFRSFYRKKQKEKSLKTLVKSYEHNGVFDGIAEFLQVSKDPIPTLLFLAKSYVIQGDNQQAIKIYLTLIEQLEDSIQKLEALEELGNAYFYAGFLHKAQDIYLEVLKNNPRNVYILSKLIELYETLGEYKKALEATECMEEALENLPQDQNQKALLLRNYLKIKLLTQDFQIDLAKKQKFCEILSVSPQLKKVVLAYLKLCNVEMFWEFFPQEDVEEYIDLLWDFHLEQIPKDILQNPSISEVFRAKGYHLEAECSNFALESVRLLNEYSKLKANLGFSYQCKECQTKIPFDSFRCPSCGELGSMKLILKPQRKQDEKNFSLL